MNQAATAVLAATLLGMVDVPASGQGYGRDWGSFVIPVNPFGAAGYLSMNATGPDLVWEARSGTTYVTVARRASDFDIPGSAQDLGGGLVLICGRDSSTNSGYIQCLQLVPGASSSIQEVQGRSYPSRDFGSVWFTSGNLFAYDVEARQLLVAPYTPPSPLPAESEFVIAVDSDWFQNQGSFRMYRLFATPAAIFSGVGVGLQGTQLGGDGPWNIWNNGGSWSVRSFGTASVVAELVPWSVLDEYYHASNATLSVGGVQGSYEIVDSLSGVVVGSGTTPDTEYHPISVTLTPGRRYAVVSAAGSTPAAPRSFITNVRYGEPIGAGNIVMQKAAPTDSMFIGNTGFSMTGTLVWENQGIDNSAMVPVFLWVTSRPSSGVDPVVMFGEQALLSRVDATLGPINVAMGSAGAGFGFPVPIPDVPELVGEVVLWQFGGTVGTDVIISDVIGAEIQSFPVPASYRPPPPGSRPSTILQSRTPAAVRVWEMAKQQAAARIKGLR